MYLVSLSLSLAAYNLFANMHLSMQACAGACMCGKMDLAQLCIIQLQGKEGLLSLTRAELKTIVQTEQKERKSIFLVKRVRDRSASSAGLGFSSQVSFICSCLLLNK